MSPERDEELAPRTRPVGWRLVLLVLVLIGAFTAAWHWQRLPFVTDQQNMREVGGLLETTRDRPLTDDEIDRLIALLNSETPAAQLAAVVTLEIAVGREPSRRPQAVAAFDGCPETASPEARQEARRAAARLKTPQKQADELSFTAPRRRLTDAEFERVVALVSAELPAVQLSAIRTLQVTVGLDPDRRGRVIAALESCPATTPPEVLREARQVAARLRGSPNPP